MHTAAVAFLVVLLTCVVLVGGFLAVGFAFEKRCQRKRQAAFVQCLRELAPVMDAARVTYFIDYGTLLGHVREKDVILGDEDIDFAVWVDSPEDEARLLSLVPRIHALPGYVCRLKHIPRGFKLAWHLKADRNIGGDVYVYTRSADTPSAVDKETPTTRTSAVIVDTMNGARYAAHAHLPVKREPFGHYDFEVCVPANPEVALLERYGDTWRTPIPFGKSKADESEAVWKHHFLRAVITWRDLLGIQKEQ